jgi:hypothetical protein
MIIISAYKKFSFSFYGERASEIKKSVILIFFVALFRETFFLEHVAFYKLRRDVYWIKAQVHESQEKMSSRIVGR